MPCLYRRKSFRREFQPMRFLKCPPEPLLASACELAILSAIPYLAKRVVFLPQRKPRARDVCRQGIAAIRFRSSCSQKDRVIANFRQKGRVEPLLPGYSAVW